MVYVDPPDWVNDAAPNLSATNLDIMSENQRAHQAAILDRTRSATLVVAASDASTKMKNAADYLCDGTADEVEINAAIAAAPPGGKVVLSGGRFLQDGPINILRDNVTLEGMNRGQPFDFSPSVRGGTILVATTSFTSGAAGVFCQRSGSAQSLVGVHLRDFTMNLNALPAGTVDGVYYEAKKGSIYNLWIYAPTRHGMQFKSAVAEDCYDNNIAFNRVENADADAYYFANRASDNLVTYNIGYNAAGNGMTFEDRASGNKVSGNYLYTCAGKGISSATMHQQKFVDNRIQDVNGGMYFANPTGSSGGFLVVANTLRNCSKAADNTWDAINLAPGFATVGGLISANDFYVNAGFDNGGAGGAKYRPRYLINNTSANMDSLTIGPNSYGYADAVSAFGTAYINDAGTNTKIMTPEQQKLASGATITLGDGSVLKSAGLRDPAKANFSFIDDEFVGGTTTSGQVGTLGWLFTNGATITFPSAEANHPGLLKRDTSATISTVAYMNLRSTLLPADFFDMLWIFRLNTNDANTTVRIGMTSDTSTASPPTAGIYLEKLDADTSWYPVCRAASAQNTRVALAATSTNFLRLRIRRVSSTLIGFSIDGGTEQTVSGTTPTAAQSAWNHIVNSAASAKTMDIDYFSLQLPATR